MAVALADAYNVPVTVRCASLSRSAPAPGITDDGRGERDDLRAAVAFPEAAGKTVTDLAGYSFGAWINLVSDPLPAGVCRLLLVAPPVAYLEFDGMDAAVGGVAGGGWRSRQFLRR